MKKTISFFCALSIAPVIAISGLYAEDGICHRCEVIREHNKTSHQNYEYYEDYLKAEGKGESQTSNTPAIKNSGPSEAVTPNHNAAHSTTKNAAKKDVNSRKNSNKNTSNTTSNNQNVPQNGNNAQKP